jgi:hypothetical protein
MNSICADGNANLELANFYPNEIEILRCIANPQALSIHKFIMRIVYVAAMCSGVTGLIRKLNFS